jgi:hypothetical protein
MPTLTHPHAVLPSDTTIPGLTRRRIWKAPELQSHSLLVMTLPRLYLTPYTGEPKPELLAAVENVPLVDTILGPLATVIDLQAIRRVRLDLLTNTVTIDHQTANSKLVQVLITFTTSELADAVFTKLWRRLGTRFEMKTDTTDSWDTLADLAPQPNSLTNVLPSWRIVCGIGGGLVAAGQVWLYRRLTRPPERLELRMV